MPRAAQSGTLTQAQVEDVEITDAHPDGITVINRSQTGAIWVRLDGPDPEVEGDNSHPVLGVRYFPAPRAQQAVTVKLLSDEALDYTVEGTVRWERPA